MSRAKLMAAMLLASSGTPFMYYGEAIGLPQVGAMDDRYRRALMQWDASDNAGFNTSGKRWLDNASWFPWSNEVKPGGVIIGVG
jgi:glycosidase